MRKISSDVHTNSCQNEILLPGGQTVEQVYRQCCIRMLKDVMPMSTVPMRCAHGLIANGNIGKPAGREAWNEVLCCETGTASNTAAVGNEVHDPSSLAVSNKRRRDCSGSNLCDEQVLVIVTQHTNWNPLLICFLSCICKKMNAVSYRILWREFCLSRAPNMVSDLLRGAKDGRIGGGWQALGKLFLYCSGCCHTNTGSNSTVPKIAGHFVPKTRFSCTTGRSFLLPHCRTDVLYMSDPCEHANDPEDVGVFRGVFKGFDKSETKKLIISLRMQLEREEKCPFCKAGVWSMGRARMIPRSAITRLAAFNDDIEYFICLNGHVNGRCALLHLSDSDASDADE